MINGINKRIDINNRVASSVKTLKSLHVFRIAVVLVHVAMVLLDKAFLADLALKSSQLQMASYMVFHIAELL